MALVFYNTASRQKENFEPIKSHPGPIGIYSCGPTVYLYPHIGNMRAYIFSDVLHRALKARGFEVKHVINITDVGHLTSDADSGEDKVEKEALAEGKTTKEVTAFYSKAFFDDLQKLNIQTENIIFPKATDHISEQITLIKKLEERGFTYKTKDGLYFDTAKFPDYGQMAKLDLGGLREGARVEINPEKKSLTDFALWKFSKPEENRQQEWKSPWGKGFPGWHIECSAMSMKYLGSHFDIHTGGIDHIPVHHTNEIAQSEAATGTKYVNYWLHSGHVLVDGQKMSKSLGNVYRLDDLSAKSFDPLAYRYFVLQASYRQTINFTWEALGAAAAAYHKILLSAAMIAYNQKLNHKPGKVLTEWKKLFWEEIDDDLNTSGALAVIWKLFDSKENLADILSTVLEFDEVLGLNLKRIFTMIDVPKEIWAIAEERELAKKEQDWNKADGLREKIRQAGYSIIDLTPGPFIYKI